MPALKELAPLLTELAALKARVEELLAENAALRAQLDRLARDAKRQAAPFSKGQRKAQPVIDKRLRRRAIVPSPARAESTRFVVWDMEEGTTDLLSSSLCTS